MYDVLIHYMYLHMHQETKQDMGYGHIMKKKLEKNIQDIKFFELKNDKPIFFSRVFIFMIHDMTTILFRLSHSAPTDTTYVHSKKDAI